MNVAIYARYSSSSQREASIEEQIKVCKEFAERNKYTVVKEYCDNALTGTNDNRPSLQRLIKDSSKKIFDMVIVYSIDRFGRNLKQLINNIEKLEKDNNIQLVSATETFSEGASGRFFRNIMMSYAQYYSEELAEKITRGMDYNGERCLCTGGNIALGFKVNKDKQFEIDPDTAPIVQMIFEMYADGKTVAEITKHLNSLGYKTARNVAFNKNSLHSMLKNKRYIGVYTYKGKEIPDGMPRIISDEVFNKVAERMGVNRKAPARKRAKVEYLLTTKLFCGHCKEEMTGTSATGKQKNLYRYYICNHRKEKKCDKKMVKKDYIEQLVIAQCRKLLSDSNIEKIAREVSKICEAERDTSNLRYLQKQLSENERKRNNALNAILETDSATVRESLYEKISQLESEQEYIKEQISKETMPFPSLTEPKIKFFLTKLKDGSITDFKYQKMLIKIFVNAIYLYDDRVTITFNSGDDTVTINDRLLTELEENDTKTKNLFLDSDGPPTKVDNLNFAFKFSTFLFFWNGNRTGR